MPSRIATLALGAALTCSLTGLTGCDSGGSSDGPAPDDTAAALAAGLAAGDLSDVEFAGRPSQQVGRDYAATVEGMGGLEPQVEVGEVHPADGAEGDDGADASHTATAGLDWTWQVGGREWSYQTQATLTQDDDQWQVHWDRAVVAPELDDQTTLDLTPIRAARGEVLGAHGVPLVTDRPVVRFGIDKTKVPQPTAVRSARRLAQAADIDADGFAKRVEAAGAAAFVEAITYRRGEVPPALRAVSGIPGAVGLSDELPLAPTKEFAAPILGSVGPVTAEMVEKDPEAYQAGDTAGLSGLQARYDAQLRGTDGAVVEAVPEGGKDGSGGTELFRAPAEDGEPLRLTLDQGLELEAERLLADVGPASALVAVRPSTGEILAAANGPGNDGYNYATYGQVAPGSTFKSVSALALLRAGVRPDTVVPCAPSITVDGKRFENYSGYPSSALGDVPFRTALANSCNTAFISQAHRLGDDGLVDAAASLGMGVDHDLGFPAYLGSVEPPRTRTEKAADMIGQGTVLASPMTMATVLASISSGDLVVPRLVKAVSADPPADVDPVSGEEAAALRGLLRGVVTSGSGRGLLDLPGPPAIAKTGTAEFERDGKVLTHAWMIGAQGDLAVAVFVDVGDSGSGTAGPILEGFLRAARS